MLYHEALKEGVGFLREAGIEEADVDAWLLFSFCFSINRTAYLMNQKERVSEESLQQYRQLLTRRAKHEPVQYLCGTQDFYGLTFQVNEHVLIPRLDTEVLVDEILKKNRDAKNKQTFLDLCTGSGCIAITLAKEGNFIHGDATDLSPEALVLAKENAKANEVLNLDFYQGDLWEAVPIGAHYDVIVSNPPYIAASEKESLLPEVAEHEPKLALFAAEEGLEFYRRIIEQAGDYLNPDGRLCFEIGCTQAGAVCDMLNKKQNKTGYFDQIEVIRDLAGLDRVVMAVWRVTNGGNYVS